MQKTVKDLILIENQRLNHDNNLLILKADISLEGIKPGQFVNILVEDSPNTFLRRPFSINFVDFEANTLHVMVKSVGDGSKKLASLPTGTSISVIFPLGNSFSDSKAGETVLLIGGGVGVAPMLYLAKTLKEQGADVKVLFGSRTDKDQILLDQYSKYATVLTTTEDGSLGTKGYVTDHDIFKSGLKGVDKVYCCGPEPMMKAIAAKCKENSVYCEASLENMMACGFGVCLCCVTDTTTGNRCVCTEGPIFNINDLNW